MNQSQSIALSNYRKACEHLDRIVQTPDTTLEQRGVAEADCREIYAQLINTVELDYSKRESVSAAMARTFPDL